MYETAIEVAKDKLLFRVMIPNEKREILVSGTYSISMPANPDAPTVERLSHGGSHLTCFAGGMFALGAKVFDRKEDLDIAAKLTDGCVWAYETTASGIMPETFIAVPCDDRKNCPWNVTKWWDEVDPNPQWRQESYDSQMEVYYSQLEELRAAKETAAPAKTSSLAAVKTQEPGTAPVKESRLKSSSNMEKRQLDDALGGKLAAAFASKKAADVKDAEALATSTKEPESAWTPPSATVDDTPLAIYSPTKPLSHEEFAKQRIEEDRIPPGMRIIQDRRYILR
jgi:mannosyl-oligosaccharide alpha-1,2-mannosidase